MSVIDRTSDVNKEYKDGQRLLHFACYLGHISAVDKLLQKKVSLNVQDVFGNTPLLYATKQNHLSTIQKPSSVSNFLFTTLSNVIGIMTARQSATEQYHQSAMEILVKAGADVHIPDKSGNTIVHVAAESGNAETMTYILSLPGIDGRQVNKLGQTAFDVAVEMENFEVVPHLTGWCIFDPFIFLPIYDF